MRAAIICTLLLAVGLAHWLVPVDQLVMNGVHVALRKVFILPVVLAAIWFQTRGAMVAAAGTTLIYLPHVLLQWAGHAQENMSQVGDVAVLWVVALLTGELVGRERSVLHELARSHVGAVRSLVAALDAREHSTEVHSLRVQAYARRIAEEMHLTRQEHASLETGALLHDVGKIGVPDHILLKPSPLDEAEWDAMRRHPEIGCDILHSAAFDLKALEIVRYHHERFDGSGYPAGLRGEEIPRIVRVFAVADAFDAMTSARPYKEAMSIARARGQVEKARGTHFDPHVVDAFMHVPMAHWRGIAIRLRDESAGIGCAPQGAQSRSQP